jgi:hypothetical protein
MLRVTGSGGETMIRKSVALTTLLLLSACMGGAETPSLTSCMRQIDPNYGKPKVRPKASVDAPAPVASDAPAVSAPSEPVQQIVEDAPPFESPAETPSPDAVETTSAPAPQVAPAPRAARATAAPARRYASAPPPRYMPPEAERRRADRADRLAAREERLDAREARLAYRERRAAQNAYDRRVSRDQRRSCLAASIDDYSTPAEIRRARLRCRDAG